MNEREYDPVQPASEPETSIAWQGRPWTERDDQTLPPEVQVRILPFDPVTTETPSVTEQMRALKAVRACPHRIIEGCGCQGAFCRAGKGNFDNGRISSVQNCLQCVSDSSDFQEEIVRISIEGE